MSRFLPRPSRLADAPARPARRVLIGLLALVQVLVLATASVAAAKRWVALPLDDDGMYVLLVMGSDMGPPRADSVLQGRADGIHLVVVDEAREHVSIMSFPRDSYVPVRGMGTTKINAMLTRGPENAVGTMEDLTGLDIDDWIVTGFDAMIIGIDEFGGVHHDVEQRLSDAKANTNLQPGRQRLTGWSALGYSRDRNSRGNGDIGRSTGQGRLLASMHRELIDDVTSPTHLMDLAGILRRHTVSSISTDRLVRLGLIALRIDPDDVVHVTAPGNVGTAGAASVYRLSDGAFGIMADLRDDGRLAQHDAGD
jgi:polyisoprenyl-teichoic acid--peptidoglycan teichoic acid transferase